MREILKSMASNIGIGMPWFTILYFSNPTLMDSLNNMELAALVSVIVICKELAIWGLKE